MPSKSQTQSRTGGNLDDLASATAAITARGQEVYHDFIERQLNQTDELGLNEAFFELGRHLMANPERIIQAQHQAVNGWLDLWSEGISRWYGEPAAAGDKKTQDRRFRHDAWQENPFFDFVRKSYLLAADTVQSMVGEVEGMDEKTAKKAAFFTRQYIDAMSPSNFMLTNPEVIENTLASQGQNLLRGLENFCRDFDPDSGQLRIRMAKLEAFEPGRNVAATSGKVVYQNELMQLIQYSPTTTDVYQVPLLIVPPWINKFYILDLQPKNSLVKWLTEQGHTVFVVSWVNPGPELANKDFGDYIFDGVLAALSAVEQATGERQVNAIGYCIGGTLLAATLALMKARNDDRIRSATFFTTLIDFTEPGDLGVFIDEHQIAGLEEKMNARGFHDGKDMAMVFNMLRANDLIWSFYVNNYLLGKEPLEFDLLYWNSDSTRLPAKMHSTYLRKMYLENVFRKPGGLVVDGVPLDIAAITTPAYFISTEEDHIAPWRSTYAGAQLFQGPVRFVLGKSGHIAGIINHPDARKYGYYTGPAPASNPEDWYAGTSPHEGSWWPDWQAWVQEYAGDKVPARIPGEGSLPALEAAPGSYVLAR